MNTLMEHDRFLHARKHQNVDFVYMSAVNAIWCQFTNVTSGAIFPLSFKWSSPGKCHPSCDDTCFSFTSIIFKACHDSTWKSRQLWNRTSQCRFSCQTVTSKMLFIATFLNFHHRGSSAMSVVDIASSQTSSVISFSVEPEHPEAIVDHVLPFIGFGNTECEVNEYIVFPMMTGHYFTFAPSLEACNSRWCPWDESLDPEKLLHFLVTEVGLYVRIQEHLTRHNFVITLSTSSNPDMVKTMPFEVHLLSHIETIELLEGNDWKNQNHHLRKAAGHNSVSPYYCGTGYNFSVEGHWKISMMGNKK